MAELRGLKLEQRHGKSRVRVARVWRDRDGKHHFAEWSVNISLISDCLPAYVSGDNSDIVATDTMKNTVSTSIFFFYDSLFICINDDLIMKSQYENFVRLSDRVAYLTE